MQPSSPSVAAPGHHSGWTLPRIRSGLVGTYLLLLAVLAAVVVKLNQDERNQSIEQGRRQTMATARVLMEHMVRTFGEVDQVLVELAEDASSAGGLERIDAARTHALLVRRKALLPQAIAVGTVFSSGAFHAASLSHPPPPTRFESREPFKSLAHEVSDRLVVGVSQLGPASGQWIFPVARRITLADGQFGGIVGATLSTRYFEQFYNELGLTEAQSIAVMHAEGWILFRHPFDEKIARGSLANSPALAPENRGVSAGSYIRTSPFDGQVRMVGYQWLPDRSFAVLATLRVEDMLAKTNESAARNWFAGGMIALLFGAIYFLLYRSLKQRESGEMEVRKLNEELEQHVHERTAALENAVRELESYSYSISHDLRAPLRAINGFSQMLREHEAARLSEEGRGWLERIVSNSNRMGDLIDDILEYARCGRMPLDKRRLDMQSLAQEVLATLRETYPRSEVRIDPLPPVMGDAIAMRQVLLNLLDNALKYSAKQPQPLVQMGAEVSAEQAVFSVRDNGIGFDMSYADRLFGVFQRLHRDGEIPGTGVGLAIVKRIIERHGGRIWAESAPNAGTTFFFSLPSGPQD